MLSSTRTTAAAASSSSARLTASLSRGDCTSASPALQDKGKGKGRATSPETPNPHCNHSEEGSNPRFNIGGSLCLPDTDTIPKTTSTDSASPLTPPFLLSDSASFPSSSWESNEDNSVSIDLGDPFTFDPFAQQQLPYHSKAVLGMRRRPYQSGTTSISPPTRDEDRLSRMDRASIFTGLRSSAARSPPPSLQPLLPLNESMSSSSKRSFEEAISPISSPPSANDGSSGISLHQGSSQGFSSSLSHSIDALRSSRGGSSFTSTSRSQATRRRVPHKRRRAAASSSSTTEDGVPAEAMLVDGGPSRSMGQNTAQATPMWPSLQSSFEDNAEANIESVDLPTSTTQLLRQWWVDAEEPPTSGSQYGSDHSTVAEMGSEQDVTETQAGRSEATFTSSTSSTASISGSLPGSHTVLRRLRLQERDEEEDVRVQDTGTSTANDTDYHDQLMDVFRRMNDRSSEAPERSTTRPPLRSTIMMRSTTQSLSRNSSQVQAEDMADDASDVGDIIASYMEAEDVVNQAQPPPTMLPSARAFASERAQARLSQAALTSRMSALQAQHNAYQELARRNQEVLLRYSDPSSRVRPRHTGSPTIPSVNIDEARERGDQGQSTSLEALGISNEERIAGESTFHYRPPSSRRPLRAGLSTYSATQGGIDSDAPLWGEYLLSRGPLRQVEDSTAVGPSPANAEHSSSDASQYLSRLHERLASSTSSLAAARRRVGALDSNGRLRGPTRRQNEHWLGMSSGEHVVGQESDDVLSRHQRLVQSPPSLQDQERVMSTYRQMRFPDPESSVAAATPQQESTSLLNRPPRLPSLRSRSPFELPFVSTSDAATSSSADSSRTDHGSNESEAWAYMTSGLHTARPHLRPLTLSSRYGSSLTHRSPRHEATPASSTLPERRPLSTFRLSDTPLSLEERTHRIAPRTETSPPRTPTELRELFELTGRSDAMVDHLDSLSSRRRRHRDQNDAERERGELPSSANDSASTSMQQSRRLPLQSLSAGRSLRQRTSAGLHSRRRPTLLEADASAVDMEVPSRDRFDLDSLMLSATEGALRRPEISSSSRAGAAASSSRYVPHRPTSRWDRYMEEVGTSIGLRSIMEAQGHEQPFSSHSFFSSLSRLPGSSLASTLHSEIATNPANYVADDEFALRDTYEGLLQLSAQIGDVRCRSTPAQVIAKLPTCLYTDWHGGSCKSSVRERSEMDTRQERSSLSPDKGKARAKDHEHGGSKDTSCSICLESYSALDTVMSLPCNHAFHDSCLVTWLKTARSCPCCRGDVCANEPSSKTSHSSHLRILPELYF